MSKEVSLETLVSLCKRRGFIYQGSEVYGGLAGTWDYGPLGVQLKRNIMNLWWQKFVEERDDMYGVDAAILMNPKTWQASGHATGFNDPMVECQVCGSRFRIDHITSIDSAKLTQYTTEAEDFLNQLASRWNYNASKIRRWRTNDAFRKSENVPDDDLKISIRKKFSLTEPATDVLAKTIDELFVQKTMPEGDDYKRWEKEITQDNSFKYQQTEINQLALHLYLLLNVACPTPKCKGGRWSEPKEFNMMFQTIVGPVMDPSSISYLRPETAQGIFTNYKNIIDSFYPDIPFGIAQQGKAFRNEISPRDFVFRAREFEQMEIEYFVQENEWEKAFEQWRSDILEFLNKLGLPKDKIHELEVPADDRAHYSKRTIDFEFDYPHGRDELLGLAYRTDFDLQNIQKASGKSMEYKPKGEGKPFVPHVIEPSFGVERLVMAVLTSAYREDEIGGEKRSVLKLPADLAPVKVAVSPLLKNKPELVAKAQEVYKTLKKEFGNVMYDDNGNIGKRYRRQDEIGTPHCVTIDFQTLDDDTVTIRDRDTTEQKRININDICKI